MGKGACWKSDNPSLIPAIHVMEGDNCHLYAILCPLTCTWARVRTHTHTHTLHWFFWLADFSPDFSSILQQESSFCFANSYLVVVIDCFSWIVLFDKVLIWEHSLVLTNACSIYLVFVAFFCVKDHIRSSLSNLEDTAGPESLKMEAFITWLLRPVSIDSSLVLKVGVGVMSVFSKLGNSEEIIIIDCTREL